MCFFSDAIKRIYCIKEVILFFSIFNIGVDQKAVRLRMDILHHDLKPIEKLCFCILHFADEMFSQVFIHYPITSGEECKYVLDEVALIFIELIIPIEKILLEIYFFSGPEIGLG